MTVYARIDAGRVAEYPVVVAEGFAIADCYTAEFVAACVAVPDGVAIESGWVATQTGDVWSFAAPPPPVVVPAPVVTLAELQAQLAALSAQIAAFTHP